MRGKLILVVMGVLIFGFMVADVHAFCVYNKTDTGLEARQTSGGQTGRQFSAMLNPNENACCNWQTKDCNTSGKRDGIVRFTIQMYLGYDVDPSLTACRDFPIQAGGWLTVEGRDGSYRCVRHDYQ